MPFSYTVIPAFAFTLYGERACIFAYLVLITIDLIVSIVKNTYRLLLSKINIIVIMS